MKQDRNISQEIFVLLRQEADAPSPQREIMVPSFDVVCWRCVHRVSTMYYHRQSVLNNIMLLTVNRCAAAIGCKFEVLVRPSYWIAHSSASDTSERHSGLPG